MSNPPHTNPENCSACVRRGAAAELAAGRIDRTTAVLMSAEADELPDLCQRFSDPPKRGGEARSPSERLAAHGLAALLVLRDIAAVGEHDDSDDARPSWHPMAIGAAVRLLDDWLVDTGQHDAALRLLAVEVTSPHAPNGCTLYDLAAAERSAAAHDSTT